MIYSGFRNYGTILIMPRPIIQYFIVRTNLFLCYRTWVDRSLTQLFLLKPTKENKNELSKYETGNIQFITTEN